MTAEQRYAVLVDARLEVIVEAPDGPAAELVVGDALRDRDRPPEPFDRLDWSEARVVPGSARRIEP